MHETSRYDNLVFGMLCLNAVLVKFSPTRDILGRCLIRIRLNMRETSGFSSPGDNIEHRNIVR